MQLTEALAQSGNIEASDGTLTVLIERTYDGPGSVFLWDLQSEGRRVHSVASCDFSLLIEEIYEYDDATLLVDGQLESLDWQPTEKRIDWSDCQCSHCKDWREWFNQQ